MISYNAFSYLTQFWGYFLGLALSHPRETARTNMDAVGRTAVLLEEVWRHIDVRLIHVKGHSAHVYQDDHIADELAWWGKDGPPFCLLRPGGGEGASRHGPAANYEVRVERRKIG